ncbi:hypothetical protein LCGC14_0274300 [marine sediment metagenome]|uniref:Uncharacterized protein n=2 Tax=root TaxID=1 RepID=A0A9C9NDC7_9HYPH|nr:hypothetical protein [Aurantimonas coralicida]
MDKQKQNNRIEDITKRAEAAAKAAANRIGGLTDGQVRNCLGVLPKDGWFLINNLFHGSSTTFSADLVKPAAEVQVFITELLNHPAFVASA